MGRTRHAARVALTITAIWGSLALANNGIELVSRTATTAGEWSSERGRQSADGRFVVFATLSAAFDAADSNGLIDVYLKDRASGSVTRISRAAGGGVALGGHSGWNGFGPDTHSLAISDDGQRIAFLSDASNLVAGDSNGRRDAFLHDRGSGQTIRLSQSAGGVGGNGDSTHIAIAGDSSLVVFSSFADNLVAGDGNATLDLFGYTVASGALEIVSLTDADTPMPAAPSADRGAREPAVSRDGRYVAFITEVNLGASDCVGQCTETWLRDRVAASTVQVSLASGAPGTQAGSTFQPAISADGRFVAWAGTARMALPDGNSFADVFLRDRQLGTTELVSQTSAGSVEHSGCGGPSLSADGRFVALHCNGQFGIDDTLLANDVYLRDRRLGQIVRISVSATLGQPGNASQYLQITPDGRRLLFDSLAANLVAGDSNGRADVFGLANPLLRDPPSRLASNGIDPADLPQVAANGRYVFFRTAAALTADDLNGRIDLYRRDLHNPDRSGNLVRVSRGSGGADLGSDAGEYSISADGEQIAFVTSAAAIGAGKATATAIALRNMLTGTTRRGSPLGAGASKPALSGDGQRLGFVSADNALVAGDSNGVDDVYLVAVDAPDAPQRVSAAASGDANGASGAPVLSYDGSRVAFETRASNLAADGTSDSNGSTDVVLRNILTGQTRLVSASGGSSLAGGGSKPDLSASGNVVVFQTSAGALDPADGNGVDDIYALDLDSGRSTRLSLGSGASTQPRISADGTSVAFQSIASDLVAGDGNGVADVFVVDRLLPQAPRRLGRGEGGTEANGASETPALSRDGQVIAYRSSASNLAAGDASAASADVLVNGPLDPDRVFRAGFE